MATVEISFGINYLPSESEIFKYKTTLIFHCLH